MRYIIPSLVLMKLIDFIFFQIEVQLTCVRFKTRQEFDYKKKQKSRFNT